MSGSYGVGTNYLAFTVGSAGAAGTGAFTIAALVQVASGNNNAGFVGLYASSTDTRAIFVDSLHLYGVDDFSDGFGTLSHDTWYLVAITKPSGSNPWRMHLWPYASDGSGTMSHGTSTGAGNHGDGSTITDIRLGANEVASNGLIACAAIWTRVLSDAELDSMKSSQLSTWRDVSGGQPVELISLENWNGTSGASIPIGTSTYSSTTGTVSSGSNPPSFSFSLGGGTTNAPAENAAGTGTANNATVDITANAEQTSGTGASNDAQAALDAHAEGTAATGTANAATADLQVNAGNAAGTGAANDSQAAITANTESTSATGTAFDATVSTAANTNADAELGAGSGTANDASASIGPDAEHAAAAGAAFDASVAITINAESCTASGAALDAQGGAGGLAEVATGTGAADAASLAIQANAEAAAALGSALNPTTGGTTVKATSTSVVIGGRTSTAAAAARRTSSGGAS